MKLNLVMNVYIWSYNIHQAESVMYAIDSLFKIFKYSN